MKRTQRVSRCSAPRPLLGLALAAGLLAGCGGTTSSSGASGVTITGQGLEPVPGGRCAVEGNATNLGNLRVNVTVHYRARNTAGAEIGASIATFQIAPFSNFAFGPRVPNHLGQPSSGSFTNDLSCSDITRLQRVDVDVTPA